jgi:uncharacterized protein
MDVSPFEFQGPVPPAQLRGRDDLIADLTGRVTEKRVTALLGPRRFGKTSVLKRLAADLTETATVYVDLYGVQTMADVAARLDRALSRSPGPFSGRAESIAATVGIDLGLVHAEFAKPRRDQPDPTARLTQLLDVFMDTAARVPALLVIDEFSDIGRVTNAAALLRTQFQHHYREFGLLFAGSHMSTMRQMFTDREQPFYGQAEIVTIGALDGPAAQEIIRAGFEATGRDAGSVATHIHHLVAGHPQRTMLLADTAWRHTPDRGSADDHWPEALAAARTQLDGFMPAIHDELTASEQRLLRLLAHGQPPYGAKAEQLGLAPGSATNARKRLVERGHLHDDDTLVDPLFADWFRRTLPLA